MCFLLNYILYRTVLCRYVATLRKTVKPGGRVLLSAFGYDQTKANGTRSHPSATCYCYDAMLVGFKETSLATAYRRQRSCRVRYERSKCSGGRVNPPIVSRT